MTIIIKQIYGILLLLSAYFYQYALSQCLQWQYLRSDQSCVDCPKIQFCETCQYKQDINQVVCLTCPTGFQISGNVCKLQPTQSCQIAQQFYNPLLQKCLDCPSQLNCQSCALSGEKLQPYCTNCKSGYIFHSSSGGCSYCTVGQYFFADLCVNCPTTLNCADCDSDSVTGQVICLTCINNFVKLKKNDGTYTCVEKALTCVDGYYLFNGVCYLCPIEKMCLSCVPKSLSIQDAICTKCNTGYYVSADGFCTKCPLSMNGCQSCQLINGTVTCLACSKGQLINNACLISDYDSFCKAGQYYNITEQTCKSCKDDPNAATKLNGCSICKLWYNQTQNTFYLGCQSNQCVTGFTFDIISKTCLIDCTIALDPNCAQDGCIADLFMLKSAVCLQCKTNYRLISYQCTPGSTQCCILKKSCSSTTQFANTNDVCQACPNNCQACDLDLAQVPPLRCYLCATNYLNVNFKCISMITTQKCLSPLALNNQVNLKICKKCPEECPQCSYDAGRMNATCLECIQGLTLSQGVCVNLAQAQSTCGPKQYLFYGQCSECSTYKCDVCFYNNYTSRTVCLACQLGYYLIKGVCKTRLCAFSYYFNGNECIQCPYNGCKRCQLDYITQTVNCLECIDSSQTPINNQCNITCPYNRFTNNLNNNCYRCPSNCLRCNAQAINGVQDSFWPFNYNDINITCQVCETGSISGKYYQCQLQDCIIGQFNGIDIYTGQFKCLPCPIGCNLCEEAFDSINKQFFGACLMCDQERFTLQNRVCVLKSGFASECKDSDKFFGFTAEGNQRCISCPYGCSQCKIVKEASSAQPQVQCSQCQANYQLGQTESTIGKCVQGSIQNPVLPVHPNSLLCGSQQLFGPSASSQLYSCLNCPPGCASCQYQPYTMAVVCQTCLTVTMGLQYQLVMGRCTLKCPDGQYSDYVGNQHQCQACPLQCLTCVQKPELGPLPRCLSCKVSYININGTCQSQTLIQQNCTSGFLYINQQNGIICQKCSKQCGICELTNIYDISTYKCNQCTNQNDYKLENNTCVPKVAAALNANCKEKQYQLFSSTSKQYYCAPCPSYCQQCVYNSANQAICIQCDAGYQLDVQGSCKIQLQCAAETVLSYNNDKKAFSCIACPNQCNQCELLDMRNPISIICKVCKTGFIVDGRLGCKSTDPNNLICPEGTYKSLVRCLPCPLGCLVCQTDTSSGTSSSSTTPLNAVCSSCTRGLKLDNGRCKSYCPLGFFAQIYNEYIECIQCNSNCVQCQGPTSSDCTKCRVDQYLYQSNQTISSSQMQYGICKNKASAMIEQQILDCPFRSSWIPARKGCVCKDGYLMINNECQKNDKSILDCSMGYYLSADGSYCLECFFSQNCSACIGGDRADCRQCIRGYYLNQENFQCYQCSIYCEECVVENSCEICQPGYYRVMKRSALTNEMQYFCSETAPTGLIINLNSFARINQDIINSDSIIIQVPQQEPSYDATCRAVFGKSIIIDDSLLPFSFVDGIPIYNGVKIRVDLVPCRKYCGFCTEGYILNLITRQCQIGSECQSPFSKIIDTSVTPQRQVCQYQNSNILKAYIIAKGQNSEGTYSTQYPLILEAQSNFDINLNTILSYQWSIDSIKGDKFGMIRDGLIDLDSTDLRQGRFIDLDFGLESRLKNAALKNPSTQKQFQINPEDLEPNTMYQISVAVSNGVNRNIETRQFIISNIRMKKLLAEIGLQESQFEIVPDEGRAVSDIFTLTYDLSSIDLFILGNQDQDKWKFKVKLMPETKPGTINMKQWQKTYESFELTGKYAFQIPFMDNDTIIIAQLIAEKGSEQLYAYRKIKVAKNLDFEYSKDKLMNKLILYVQQMSSFNQQQFQSQNSEPSLDEISFIAISMQRQLDMIRTQKSINQFDSAQCPPDNKCSGAGTCNTTYVTNTTKLVGRCVCKSGFYGAACELNITTFQNYVSNVDNVISAVLFKNELGEQALDILEQFSKSVIKFETIKKMLQTLKVQLSIAKNVDCLQKILKIISNLKDSIDKYIFSGAVQDGILNSTSFNQSTNNSTNNLTLSSNQSNIVNATMKKECEILMNNIKKQVLIIMSRQINEYNVQQAITDGKEFTTIQFINSQELKDSNQTFTFSTQQAHNQIVSSLANATSSSSAELKINISDLQQIGSKISCSLLESPSDTLQSMGQLLNNKIVEVNCIDIESGQPVNFKSLKSKVKIFLPYDDITSSTKMSNIYSKCQYLDVERSQLSSKGCEKIYDPQNRVGGILCECDHMTQFVATEGLYINNTQPGQEIKEWLDIIGSNKLNLLTLLLIVIILLLN